MSAVQETGHLHNNKGLASLTVHLTLHLTSHLTLVRGITCGTYHDSFGLPLGGITRPCLPLALTDRWLGKIRQWCCDARLSEEGRLRTVWLAAGRGRFLMDAGIRCSKRQVFRGRSLDCPLGFWCCWVGDYG